MQRQDGHRAQNANVCSRSSRPLLLPSSTSTRVSTPGLLLLWAQPQQPTKISSSSSSSSLFSHYKPKQQQQQKQQKNSENKNSPPNNNSNNSSRRRRLEKQQQNQDDPARQKLSSTRNAASSQPTSISNRQINNNDNNNAKTLQRRNDPTVFQETNSQVEQKIQTPQPPHASSPRLSTTSTSSTTSSFSRLRPPTILFSDNHLLVVNKPAGWHSTPDTGGAQGDDDENDNDEDGAEPSVDTSKCLVSYCKFHGLGGGSTGQFVLPLHRLDQPCTGVLLLGKTSKAASRIQSQWNQYIVKRYIVVLAKQQEESALILKKLKQASQQVQQSVHNSGEWMQLSGLQLPQRLRPASGKLSSSKSWSVQMVPLLTNSKGSSSHVDHSLVAASRRVSLKWRHVLTTASSHPVLEIETSEGSRHMIRALLSQVAGCPLAGDVRYSSNNNKGVPSYSSSVILPDRSVALHARSVTLLPANAGEKATANKALKWWPSSESPWIAPIPDTWNTFFSLNESTLRKALLQISSSSSS